MILIQYSVVISRLSENCKKLNQQIGILQLESKEHISRFEPQEQKTKAN